MNHRVKRVFVLTRWLYHLENLKINIKSCKRTYDTERDKNDKMINVYYKPSEGSNICHAVLAESNNSLSSFLR